MLEDWMSGLLFATGSLGAGIDRHGFESSRVESQRRPTRTRLTLDSRVHSNSSPRTRQKRSNTPPLQPFDAANCSIRHRGITDLRVHDINAEITRHPMSGGAFLERWSVGTLERWSVGMVGRWGRWGVGLWGSWGVLERLSNVGALECWSILEALERLRGGALERWGGGAFLERRSVGTLENWSVGVLEHWSIGAFWKHLSVGEVERRSILGVPKRWRGGAFLERRCI